MNKIYLPITCEVVRCLHGRARTKYDALFEGGKGKDVLAAVARLPRALPAFFHENELDDYLPLVYVLSFFPEKVFLKWAKRFGLGQVVESLYPCFQAFVQRHDAIDAFLESVVDWERRDRLALVLRVMDAGYKLSEQQSLYLYLIVSCCSTPEEEAEVHTTLRRRLRYVYDVEGFRARVRACRGDIWVFCGALQAMVPPDPASVPDWFLDFAYEKDVHEEPLWNAMCVFFAHHSPFAHFALLMLPELYLTRRQWARFVAHSPDTVTKTAWIDFFMQEVD
jgi:hypothetical protein